MRLSVLSVVFIFGVYSFLNTPESIILTEPAVASQTKLQVSEFETINTTAKAYGVFDLVTGELLLLKNAEAELPIASVTKLFTAKKILDKMEDNKKIIVTNEDIATEGRAGKLESGLAYDSSELLFPLLLESSNDAATALERNYGRVYLGDKMMDDAAGLSPKNTASVKELASEFTDLYTNYKYIFDITTLEYYIGEHTGWVNNSPVYKMDGYKGGKHGYTDAANRTLFAVFRESSLGNRDLGYIILGSDDLQSDISELRSAVSNSVSLQ